MQIIVHRHEDLISYFFNVKKPFSNSEEQILFLEPYFGSPYHLSSRLYKIRTFITSSQFFLQ
jgi:hypothetical protein